MALPCCIKSAASPLLQCKSDGIVNNGFALCHSSSSSYFSSSSSSSSSFTSSSFFTSYCGLCKLVVSLDASSAGQRKACSVKSDSGWKPPSTVVQAVVKRSPKRLKYAGAGSRKDVEVITVQVDPFGSDTWRLDQIVDLIKNGGVGVIPTDTVYAIVCDLKHREAIDRLYRIKNMDPKKPLSILCRSFQDIDTYTMGFPRGNSQGQTNIFRAARQCLPGPYTFILQASKNMPKQCTTFGGSAAMSCAPRKSVGVRMPDDVICKAILEKLDEPLLCTSVKQRAEDEWMLDPVIIADTYGASDGREGVDFVVDGGERLAYPSTVVDMTGQKPTLLRRGKGLVEDWMLMEAHDSTEATGVDGLANPYAYTAPAPF
ncbi:unnamed protein product [Sphagnum jensenii]|uniref:Threonylcarbamoyl-AMP synthase n=1 Tax=Sphagnum jensenii TaxID=128206 RepID=A0ABP1BDV2_9BRYO